MSLTLVIMVSVVPSSTKNNIKIGLRQLGILFPKLDTVLVPCQMIELRALIFAAKCFFSVMQTVRV